MTPRELWLARLAYHRRRAWLAWHIAALARAREFPGLEEFTGEKASRADPAQSLEHLAFAVRRARAMMKAAGLN